MNEPPGTIPLLTSATFERGDGVTVAVDTCDGRSEATYAIDGHDVAVAYVDANGNPRVDLVQQNRVGLCEFKRLLVVWVLAWSHAQTLSALSRGGPTHAG